MKIALVQLNYIVGAFETNKTKIIQNIHKAKEQGVKLVVFAEQAISGIPAYELLNMVPFMVMCEETLIEIASHCDDISVIVGLPIQHANKTVSVAALIQNRQVIRYIGKRYVTSKDDLGYIMPSKGVESVVIAGQKIDVVVGEDLFQYYNYGNHADTIIGICGDRYFRGVISERYNYLSQLAYVTGKNVLFVNQIGGQTDVLYDGSSVAFNKEGKAIAVLNSFEEDFRVVDLKGTPEEIELPKQNRAANTYRALKMGLKDYFEKNNFQKACLGLSGGIDSAVVLALAVNALGAENVRVLMMPSLFSSDHSVDDAIEMADLLGVGYGVIPITEVYKTINETMIPVIGGTEFDVTEENIQARIRMMMLMAMSNKFGHILLNTSNKSEIAVGYDTLYGDSAGSLGVIGDIYKIEVYEVARYINRNKLMIPESIISKEPSAELRPEQKDSDSLPPYEMLDAVLQRFIEERQLVYEIIDAGFDSDMVYKVLKQMRASAFKRHQACPVLKVSPCPFRSHFKIPLIERFIL